MKDLKSLTVTFALTIACVSVSKAGPVVPLSGTLLEEPSGIPLYENVYALESGETGGQANIRIHVSEYAEQITATIFIHAGPTPFTLGWLNNTVHYQGSAWYEQADLQGKFIPVETDSWNQIEWQFDNLARTLTVSVDGELLVSKTDQLPAWSANSDPGTISIHTDGSEGTVTWTDVLTATHGQLSVAGENDSPELGGDPEGEFSRIQAIGYTSGPAGSSEMSESEQEAYRNGLFAMARNLDPGTIKKALQKRKNRDHLSTDRGLFTPLQGNN